VEHVFADQQNAMGGKIVRTIGIARARVKIGMMNLVYNMHRLVQLERIGRVRLSRVRRWSLCGVA
jgi:transposase, IS5 family